jgi:translation elongation factor EF-1alpha
MRQHRCAVIVVCGPQSSGKSTLFGKFVFPQSPGEGPSSVHHLKDYDSESEYYSLLMSGKIRQYCKSLNKSEVEMIPTSKYGRHQLCNVQDFVTVDDDNIIYDILDSPGHPRYVDRFIEAASLADIAVLVISADPAEDLDNQVSKHYVAENGDVNVQGDIRFQAQILHAQGLKRLIVAVNKMDLVSFSACRYSDIVQKLQIMFKEVGFATDNILFVPVSGLYDEYSVFVNRWKSEDKYSIASLLDCLNFFSEQIFDGNKKKRSQNDAATLTQPIVISTLYRLPLKNDCGNDQKKYFGKVEQGFIGPNLTQKIVDIHSKRNSNINQISVTFDALRYQPGIIRPFITHNFLHAEIHHGDVLIQQIKDEPSPQIQTAHKFTAIIQTGKIPHLIKIGYCPVAFVGVNKSACRLLSIKKTTQDGIETREFLKSRESAECEFEVLGSLLMAENDSIKESRNLQKYSRILFIEMHAVVMVGKILKIESNLDQIVPKKAVKTSEQKKEFKKIPQKPKPDYEEFGFDPHSRTLRKHQYWYS